MDASNFKTPDWLMIGGGAAMLILGFALDWTTVDTGFGSASGDGPFDYFITGGIAWILIVAVGALAVADGLGKLPTAQPWPIILLGMAALGTLLMLLCLLLGARFDFADRGIGMYGAFVWAAIALAGAYMNFTSKGGNVKDLTDMDKLKASFNQGGSSSGGDTPPPPPPPSTPSSDSTPPADPPPPPTS
jgi:hypothetical protein